MASGLEVVAWYGITLGLPLAVVWARGAKGRELRAKYEQASQELAGRPVTHGDIKATIKGLFASGREREANQLQDLLREKEYGLYNATLFLLPLKREEREAEQRQAAYVAQQRREQELHAAQQLWRETGDTRVQGVPEYRFNEGGWEWVYVFTYPSHTELAKLKGEAPLVKIGMTTNHYKQRIAEQTRGSGIAESPVIVMAVRCADAAALERHLHIELREHHAQAGAGTEWFRVKPEQILHAMNNRVHPL